MKLTKQDIDKVRHIEGFPIARDEDIIALSRPPYYTACPNPFIEDFIRENGTTYDEATDDYHREPFAADVSEGKSDAVYGAHNYHTKVPYKAIMRYILHYTEPGDIVFDGFCGTGMTGVAAQMCGCPDAEFRHQIEFERSNHPVRWGARRAILNDLSPAAAFIAHNYNHPAPIDSFEREAKAILEKYTAECAWMYETIHIGADGKPIIGLDGKPMIGRINYTVWSDVFVCPSCSKDFAFMDAAFDFESKQVRTKFNCPYCGSILTKKDCSRQTESIYDQYMDKVVTIAKQVPVLIQYSVGSKKYEKRLDEHDFEVIERVKTLKSPYWVPVDELPAGLNTDQPRHSHGVTNVHLFYTQRNLYVISCIMHHVRQSNMSTYMHFLFEQVVMGMAKIARYVPTHFSQVNQYLSGTLYIGSQVVEVTPEYIIGNKIPALSKVFGIMRGFKENDALIQTASVTNTGIPENSVDYIFTDPPFGNNLNYSELNFLWEVWYKVRTNNQPEAIVNAVQKKGIAEYQDLMEQSFIEYYRVLKPGHWMTVEFHNSQNAVWNAISEALAKAGFVIADIRVLDKKQGSFKQIVSTSAVKQDLVISAYKPREAFVREFQERAGDPDMAWEFVQQHLRNVPIVADGNRDGKLDIIAERQDYLLFDRMVAWHIMNGIPVPMDAHTFYEGLRQRFLQRDGMFFLPDQVNEYDEKRAHMELDVQQLSFVVTDEKNAIAWLNYILRDGPKTYQEIQPAYLQELHQSKQEKMPELLDMLRENFVQDEKGAWYVPDLSNAADLAKVRRKALLKEFYDSCVPGKAKLKVFRMEAIRAGFDECWKARDFKTIVTVGEKLPEAVLQEDPALLMYYDNACARV